MFDLRRDHDQERGLLQVCELRQYVGVCLDRGSVLGIVYRRA